MSALKIEHLHKIYKGGLIALNDVTLEVAEGEFFGLLGPNGAGKSTLINILASLTTKTRGHVEIFGNNIDTRFAHAKNMLSIVSQEFNFNGFESPLAILTTQAGYYGIPRAVAKTRAEHNLKQLGLWDKRNQYSRLLSGGMKRRLMIARALMHQPQLLILDEPTAGVDIELRHQMWEFLQKLNADGTTIILTTHYLEEAEHLCKQIAIINKGKVIQNLPTKQLLAQLDVEILIFDLEQSLPHPPQLATAKTKLLDPQTLEIEIDKTRSLNELFQELSTHGITIKSMRNKINRLEELFMQLTAEE